MSDSAPDSRTCPKCGSALPADAAEGLCPRCLMGEAMQPTGPKKAWEPPTAAELAKMLPQYEVEKLLGRGGMGAVYQGTQKSLDRPVAIKILSATLDESDQGFSERFKNEARAMARLKHGGIVDVYQFGEMPNGLLYIVMEYIDGTDVAKMIAQKGRLHTDHAMAITAHVCDALAYAHERGIIHRDIKPANIMVGYDGVVKVADFGLAKMTHGPESGLTQSGMAMGTLHYMAPEALMLGTAVDHRADIYAVGVMLYQMLTGKLPQGMFNMPSLMVKGLDPRYDSIIGKALVEDRDARYQSVNELRMGLDEILTQLVAKVEAGADKAPAALDTLARPQRPEVADERHEVEHAGRRTASWHWGILIGILVLGSWEYLRKRPAAALTPPDASAPGDVAGVTLKPGTQPPTRTAPTIASKDAPFVNSIGMKFVPVPGTNVLFCIHETRYRDYAVYAAVEKAVNPAWKNQKVKDFKPVGRLDDHPVANVSWEDAQGFCAWLSKKEARPYRLPSDREWSLAVGIGQVEKWDQGTTPATVFKDPNQFPWGSEWPPAPGSGNYSDESRKALAPHDDASYFDGYDDGFPTTAPVMSFKPNPFGLYDLGGNLWEWCEDWHDARQKDRRVLRGASWYYSESGILLSSHRTNGLPGTRNINYGFRLVLVGSAAAPAIAQTPERKAIPSVAPAKATQAQPFVNTLEMKFVPVPGTQVLFCLHETRRRDYTAYAAEAGDLAHHWENLKESGFMPAGRIEDHPVSRVNWDEAQGFCAWLSQKEGRTYRLPTDREWSTAVGLGQHEKWDQDTTPATVIKLPNEFPWGSPWPPPPGSGNYSDASRKARAPSANADHTYIDGYDDGFPTTAPVMSFKPNRFGLHDLGGNMLEWCEDWFDSAKIHRVLRGGDLGSGSQLSLRSSARHHIPPTNRGTTGFRCVLEIGSLKAQAQVQNARGTPPPAAAALEPSALKSVIPPPSAASLLEQQYLTAIAKEVTPAVEAYAKTLLTSYRSALERAEQAPGASPAEMGALKAEINRVAKENAMPGADAPGIAAAIAALRATYRKSLEAFRTRKSAPLQAVYETQLKARQQAELRVKLEQSSRELAAWVIRAGGKIGIKGRSDLITTLQKLPAAGPLVIDRVDWFKAETAVLALQPADLARLEPLQELRELELRGHPVGDQGAAIIARMFPQLTKLNLHACEVTDEGMVSLSTLTRLEHLDLGWSHGKITDKGVSHLISLKKLRRLTLQDAAISNVTLMQVLPKLPVLEWVMVHGLPSQITPGGIAAFKQMRPDCEIVN